MTCKAQSIALRRQVRRLQRRLAQVGPVMRGSVVVIGTRNKQPYFSLNKDKRTYLIYLGQKRVARAQEYSQNYKRLLAIVEEMTILNMQLLKSDVIFREKKAAKRRKNL